MGKQEGMMNSNVSTTAQEKPTMSRAAVLLRFAVALVIMATILFGLAGRLDWAMGWLFVIVYGATYVVVILMVPVERELESERRAPKADTPAWDKLIATAGSILSPVGFLIVAGLDQRFGWTRATIPLWIQIAALVSIPLGYGLASWAVAANRFFARYVRIQKERGHTVVTSGPYRFVRHPGYVGASVTSLAIPLALGSLWAFALGGVMVALMVIRTGLEDRFLQAELPGYKEYAARVHYRLLPGIW